MRTGRACRALETFERDREMRAALVARDGWISSTMMVVTVVQCARGFAAPVTSRYSDSGVVTRKLRRPLDHRARRIDCGRVAGAHLGPERGQRHPQLCRDLGDLASGVSRFWLHVDGERLQR